MRPVEFLAAPLGHVKEAALPYQAIQHALLIPTGLSPMPAIHGYQVTHFRGKDPWNLNVVLLGLDSLEHGCQEVLLHALKVAKNLFEDDD